MSQRFYINWPLAPGPVELAGPEAHHLAAVSRLRPGDQLTLFNGDGQEYPAQVEAITRRTARLEVFAPVVVDRELGFSLEIAAPLPKGDRAQFLVEKLTELGVTSFVPLLCRRSIVQPGEGKIDKLQRYVIEASKQCGRNVLMRIDEPEDWANYCRRAKPAGLRVLAHPRTDQPTAHAHQASNAKKDIACAVGPEGGFTQEEIAPALSQGWQTLQLGPRILRLETAALYLAAWAIFYRGTGSC